MLLVFDIDGTLTDPRQPMDPEFKSWFKSFATNHMIFFVTGSDYPKVIEQVGDLVETVDGVWTCSGNEMWMKGNLEFQSDWAPSPELIAYLNDEVYASSYDKYGTHIEIRTGMVNFSPCGREATQQQRHDYRDWDALNNQRVDISARLKANFPELDCAIGGDISIDIYPMGKDKSQVLPFFCVKYKPIFFADNVLPGGNDYPLAKLLDNVYHIEDGYKETWELLKDLG